MSLDLESHQLANRHPERWRPFLQAAHGVWKRCKDSQTGTLPTNASRAFF
jgi:hypothetical protein